MLALHLTQLIPSEEHTGSDLMTGRLSEAWAQEGLWETQGKGHMERKGRMAHPILITAFLLVNLLDLHKVASGSHLRAMKYDLYFPTHFIVAFL